MWSQGVREVWDTPEWQEAAVQGSKTRKWPYSRAIKRERGGKASGRLSGKGNTKKKQGKNRLRASFQGKGNPVESTLHTNEEEEGGMMQQKDFGNEMQREKLLRKRRGGRTSKPLNATRERQSQRGTTFGEKEWVQQRKLISCSKRAASLESRAEE